MTEADPKVSHILRDDLELGEAVTEGRRAEAIEACVARVARIPRGRWSIDALAPSPGGIGLLVLEGLLLRRVGVDGRFGAELLGEGDLLQPWRGEQTIRSLAQTTAWRVLRPARLAVLDGRGAACLAVYPELTGRLVGRALERSRNLAVNMAIVHHPRVGLRLRMLLWHLADRWGRVRTEGVILPLALTHTLLANLVAARRPTVTSALAELAGQKLVSPAKGGWLLTGEPPGELLELQDVDVPAPGPG